MFNEQRYGVVVDGSEDWRFAVFVTRIHIRTKLQQLLFYIGEESFMERCVSLIMHRTIVRNGLAK